jgi:hypothetical protein
MDVFSIMYWFDVQIMFNCFYYYSYIIKEGESFTGYLMMLCKLQRLFKDDMRKYHTHYPEELRKTIKNHM